MAAKVKGKLWVAMMALATVQTVVVTVAGRVLVE